jgi:hypothetical protein
MSELVFCRTENMTQKDMTHERPIDKQSTKAQTDTSTVYTGVLHTDRSPIRQNLKHVIKGTL